MARSARRRRRAATGRLQARGGRRAGRRAEPTRAVPLLVGYLDAVADALRDVGLTVLEVDARSDAAGLVGAISLAAAPPADDGPREPGDPDAQHDATPAGLSLVWSERTGWVLSTGRTGRRDRARRHLHPDRAPDPVSLARVVRAVLAGQLVAAPAAPADLPLEQDRPALLHAFARHAGRRR